MLSFCHKIVQFKIYGNIDEAMALRVQKAIQSSRYQKPPFVAICVNSSGGSLVQAKSISQSIHNYAAKSGAPVYCFGEDIVLNSGMYLLTSGNKCFTSKWTLLGDFGYSITQFGYKELFARLQLEMKYIHCGTSKVKLNKYEDLKEEDVKWINGILKQRENKLREQIVENRQRKIKDMKINIGQINNLWNNPLITAQQAYDHGLLDGMVGMNEYIEDRYHGNKVKDAMEDPFGFGGGSTNANIGAPIVEL